MGRHKKTDGGSKDPTQNALAIMGRQASKQKKTGIGFSTVSQEMANWRWIDFCDPLFNSPCLLLEYLWGARGMLAGRMMKIEAEQGVGKSSYMMLQYAMAQQMHDAWCIHAEGEGATAPPDFIASFGCNPDKIITQQLSVRSIESCFNTLDFQTATIRRPATGSDDKDVIDPDKVKPILAGVDSISSFGAEDNMEEDGTTEVSQGGGALGMHARFIGKFFRDRWSLFENRDVFMMIIAQLRAKMDLGPKFPGAPQQPQGDKQTTLAAAPLNYHATYRLDMRSKPLKHGPEQQYQQYGELVTFKVVKNKLSPKGKSVEVPLVWNAGFDLVMPTFTLLSTMGPIQLPSGGTFELNKKGGGWIDCPALGVENAKTGSERDIIMKLYANKDLLMALREAFRIRGFGFKFETNYQRTKEEVEDNTEPVEGAPEAVADHPMPSSLAGPAPVA